MRKPRPNPYLTGNPSTSLTAQANPSVITKANAPVTTKANPHLASIYHCPNPDCENVPVQTIPVSVALYRGQLCTWPCLSLDMFWKCSILFLTIVSIIGILLASVFAAAIGSAVFVIVKNIVAPIFIVGAVFAVLLFLDNYVLSPKMQSTLHRCARCGYVWEQLSSPIEAISKLAEGEMKRATRRGKKEEMAPILITLCFLASREKNWELVESYARESLKRCQEAKRNRITDRTTVHAVCYLGLVALYRGQYQEAASHFETCLVESRKLKDWQNIAYSLDNLALARLYQGMTDGIAAMLAESLPLLVKMQHMREMPWAFEAMAGLAALQDQPERAARLYGIGRAIRDTSSELSLALDDCPGFNQSVAATREHLGEARHGEAWQAGYTMPLEDAIAYCLRGEEAATGLSGPAADSSLRPEDS